MENLAASREVATDLHGFKSPADTTDTASATIWVRVALVKLADPLARVTLFADGCVHVTSMVDVPSAYVVVTVDEDVAVVVIEFRLMLAVVVVEV